MSRSDTITVNLSLQEFICPVMLEIPTQPVSASCCGATFELNAVKNLRSCPCCRSKEATFSAASSLTTGILQNISAAGGDTSVSLAIDFPVDFIRSVITSDDTSRIVQQAIDAILAQHPNLCEHMPFDLNAFIQIVRENKLNTLAGERFITILKNNPVHLNQPAVIAVLASTAAGRLILRKNLNIKELYDEKLLCFGNAVLSFESLRTQVDEMSVLDLLSREIAADLNKTEQHETRLRQTIEAPYQALIEELYERQLTEKEFQEFSVGLRAQFPRFLLQEEALKAKSTIEAEEQKELRGLLSLARKQGLFRTTVTAEYQYTTHAAVNDLLQQVVFGQRAQVRAILDRMKRENPTLLKTVLTSVATTSIVDYSGKKIENMTLLQAAFAAGDVAIHADLAAIDPGHQGMCEIIQSYFDESPEDQNDVASQYATVLKRSLRENYPREQIPPALENDSHELHGIHRRAQEQNTFDFSKIVAAITAAGLRSQVPGARDEVNAVLNHYREEGASFTERDQVTREKPDDQLTLTESLNRFREQYEKQALSKIAVNPYDLLKAFQIYDTQFDNWTWDQRDLFARQVIGFAQRYLSAADARVFAYGLYSAVENKEKVPDDFNFRYDPAYHLYPHPSSRLCSGLGFDYLAAGMRLGGGRGARGAAMWRGAPFGKLMSSKNSCQSNLMPRARVQSNVRDERRCVIQ